MPFNVDRWASITLSWLLIAPGTSPSLLRSSWYAAMRSSVWRTRRLYASGFWFGSARKTAAAIRSLCRSWVSAETSTDTALSDRTRSASYAP